MEFTSDDCAGALYSPEQNKVFGDAFNSATVPKVSNDIPSQNLFSSSCV